ncbi:ABC transporter substrate-binding protein [Gillisia sp. Q332]|uniref:ABC transporter substrate-binding protein n=1 Tax=Gillisia xinjiangensis TaxID=3384765 RepID=UPI00391A4F3A
MKDQLNREIHLEKVPQKIVSLVPSQTELLSYLGLEDKIAGVTKFCVYPARIRKEKKVVGGTKTVQFDTIRNLNPDIILCNKEENTQEMVRELKKIAPVHISEINNFEDSLELIAMYGELFQCAEKAEELIEDLKNEKEKFQAQIPEKGLKVAYLIWKNPWMAAGGNTFINSMLKLNGLKNVFETNPERYPQTTLRKLKLLKPDLIFLSSEPYPFKRAHIKEIQEVCDVPIILVNGEFFSWYGSRSLPAFHYFEDFQKQVSKSL